MKARWILEDPAPELPGIGRAIVASWIPGRYHQITTLSMDGKSDLSRLTESIRTGKSLKDVQQGERYFITQIIKCSKDGISHEDDYLSPIYEKEYETLEKAKEGHRMTVDLFAFGKPLPQ
jgi:hypothetical protein